MWREKTEGEEFFFLFSQRGPSHLPSCDNHFSVSVHVLQLKAVNQLYTRLIVSHMLHCLLQLFPWLCLWAEVWRFSEDCQFPASPLSEVSQWQNWKQESACDLQTLAPALANAHNVRCGRINAVRLLSQPASRPCPPPYEYAGSSWFLRRASHPFE